MTDMISGSKQEFNNGLKELAIRITARVTNNVK
jgi:hypothetical protein